MQRIQKVVWIGVFVVAGLLVGCSEQPTAPDAENAVQESKAPASVTTQSGPTLQSLYCDPTICEAQAFGGSGSLSFTWYGATSFAGGDTYDAARPNCYPGGTISVTAIVTDANGNSDSKQTSVTCPSPY